MISQISKGVKVTVETFYQSEYSNPSGNDYMFAYRITLENHNTFPVQLQHRHWFIFDSIYENYEVSGEGVIGVQPVINPSESYSYISGCNLKSEMGRMHGYYRMINKNSGHSFKINIPPFEMIVPFKLN